MDINIPTVAWSGVIGMALLLISTILFRTIAKADAKAKRRNELLDARARMLATGAPMEDLAAVNHDLAHLDDEDDRSGSQSRAVLALVLLSLCVALAGCQTHRPPAEVIFVGERRFLPKPGDVMTIPPLIPPAQQWWLVDDVALSRMGFADPASTLE